MRTIKFTLLTGCLLSILLFPQSGHSQIMISSGNQVTETFAVLGTNAVATLPLNWKADKIATVRTLGTYATAVSATEQYGGNNMTTTETNGIYNFGAGVKSTATDRALGFLAASTGTKSGNVYAWFQNSGSDTIKNLLISYKVEKYRMGSNPAGFQIQMYYSTDGITWALAGSNFLTSFAADPNNNGYASAPGDSANIALKSLTTTVVPGGNLYLAWNYSVPTSSTTSNAQALGIDNFSMIPNCIISSTPTGINATVNPICPGSSTNLSVTGGSLGTGASWQWYSGSCGGTPAGSGSTINITPGTTTDYFVRAEGNCNTTSCAQVTIIVVDSAKAATGIGASANPACNGGSTTLSVQGGSLGTSAVWKWYTGNCGTTAVGSGPSIIVTPLSATTYYVRAMGNCNATSCASLLVNIGSIPGSPGPIAGSVNACANISYTYSIFAAVPGATNYSWSVPTGWTINSGQGTISMKATPGGAGQNGNITVTANNNCGTSSPSILGVTALAGTPLKPWNIIGPSDVCDGNSAVYVVTNVPNATTYTWSLPLDWNITAGQGTDTIDVIVGSQGDVNVSVTAGNSCGTSGAYSIPVTVDPPCIVPSFTTLNLKLYIQGLYKGSGKMVQAKTYNGPGNFNPKWGGSIAEKIVVELHDATTYSTIYYSDSMAIDTIGNGSINIPDTYNGNYYITLRQRGILETTSASAVSFASSPVSYDFSDNSNEAYGGNLKSMGGGVYAVYSGEITSAGNSYPNPPVKDVVIDISDVYYIFNSYLNGDFGYLVGDVSGDGTVDLTDIYISFNNYLLGIYAILP